MLGALQRSIDGRFFLVLQLSYVADLEYRQYCMYIECLKSSHSASFYNIFKRSAMRTKLAI